MDVGNGWLVLFLLLALLFLGSSATSTRVQVAPQAFSAGLTSNVTVTCAVGNDTADVTDITVFQLSKDGVLLATGEPSGVVVSDALASTKYTVTANMGDPDVRTAYMRLTIQFPGPDDAGQYRCDMDFQDQGGFFQQASSAFTLTQNDADVVGVDTRLAQTRQQLDSLRARVSSLETQVFALVVDSNNQSNIITQMAADTFAHVAFFATLGDTLDITQDDVVVFDVLRFNNGSGYNATSGVFVAPQAGFYLFNLVYEVRTSADLQVDLRLAVDDVDVAKLRQPHSAVGGDQHSASLVYELGRGSKVRVVVGEVEGQSDAGDLQLVGESLSLFSGSLLG